MSIEALLASPHWRWMPGMLDTHGRRGRNFAVMHGAWESNDGVKWRPVGDALPDFDDPATLGCLLALVREAWGRPDITTLAHADETDTLWDVWMPLRHGSRWLSRCHPTEAEALVAAMLAAPLPTGGR